MLKFQQEEQTESTARTLQHCQTTSSTFSLSQRVASDLKPNDKRLDKSDQVLCTRKQPP